MMVKYKLDLSCLHQRSLHGHRHSKAENVCCRAIESCQTPQQVAEGLVHIDACAYDGYIAARSFASWFDSLGFLAIPMAKAVTSTSRARTGTSPEATNVIASHDDDRVWSKRGFCASPQNLTHLHQVSFVKQS